MSAQSSEAAKQQSARLTRGLTQQAHLSDQESFEIRVARQWFGLEFRVSDPQLIPDWYCIDLLLDPRVGKRATEHTFTELPGLSGNRVTPRSGDPNKL